MPKCYVGNFNDIPNEHQYALTPQLVHPRDFASYVKTCSEEHNFSNNISFVNCFDFSDVFVCYKGKAVCINKHPMFEKWKNEFAAGEL